MKRDDWLDLNDALQHPGRTIAVDLSTDLSQEEDLDLLSPLEGYLECTSTGNVLLVTGKFSVRCVLECARCGAPLEKRIEFTMEEQFPVEGTPSCYGNDDYARVVAEEDYPLFEGNHLLVESLVRQGLLVNLPVQPLCEYGWEGDCPIARERGVHRPPPEPLHPFAALKALRRDEEGDA